MSDKPTAVDSAEFARAQALASARTRNAEIVARFDSYIDAYSRVHDALRRADYPDEGLTPVAAALAAAWVKSYGD